MGNIADKFLTFSVILYFFFRRIFQTFSHLLKITAKLSNLVIRLNLQLKVQIAILDILCGNLHSPKRCHNSTINPKNQKQCCEHQDKYNCNHHICYKLLHFRHRITHIRHDKSTSLCPILILKINLLYKNLKVTSKIDPALRR